MHSSFLSIFDLDHTLLRVNSSYFFGRFLYQQNQLPFFDMLYVLGCYALHKNGWFSISQVHHLIFHKIFKGRSLSTLQNFVSQFLHIHFEQMLYLPAVERLRMAISKGHHTVVLSSSPQFLVEPIALKLGATEWKSSYYEVNEEGLLNRISYLMEGSEKACYVNLLANKWGFPKEQMEAYSDSILDLPLLKIVGKPVGVLPDRALRKICEKRGWEII